MATAVCPTCEKPLHGAARCPDCQKPVKGQPRKAPAGSGVDHVPRDTARGWDAVLFGSIALVLVVAVVIWLV